MYDSFIFGREYRDLKDYISDIYNGDVKDYDLEELSNYIHELYENGEISSSQYDDLMSEICRDIFKYRVVFCLVRYVDNSEEYNV